MTATGNLTLTDPEPASKPSHRKAIALTLTAIAGIGILGVSVFQSTGRSANAQATQLGDAIVENPAILYDQARITATADSLGVTVAFPEGFAQTGAIEIKSWLPVVNACLYLPAVAGWAYNTGDAPCDLSQPRGGPDQLDRDARAGTGVSRGYRWATPDQPLTAAGNSAAAAGYGTIYLSDEDTNGTNVILTGQGRITSGTGNTYFEARADYTCPSECGSDDPAEKVTRSGYSDGAAYTPAEALLSVPQGASALQIDIRQCVLEKDSITTCGEWTTVKPAR